MAEWTKATVLKTVVAVKVTGGSNPSPSARHNTLRGGARVDDWGRLLSG
jgi:hypothetical protein